MRLFPAITLAALLPLGGVAVAADPPYASAAPLDTGYAPPFEAPADERGFWMPAPWENRAVQAPDRFRGSGDPLRGTSWRNRPFHAGWMVGSLIGDNLVDGVIEQSTSLVGGYRLGWDFDHYWGLEGRFLFAHVAFTDERNPTLTRTSHQRYWDLDLLYYPWGDARWRPYASLGIGGARFAFRDAADRDIDELLFTLPMGVGVKYFWQKWLALRFSFTDNLAFRHDPLSTMHNLTLTGDVELHFGGRRTSYFPYHGSTYVW